jgi:uncharacterized protein (DUF302 family)
MLLAIAVTLLAADAMAAEPALSYQEVRLQIARIQVQQDVGFDDAVESLKLRANQHNLKFVGVNAVYREIEALTGEPAKRMEIFSFCDGLTANRMLKADPMMVAFMPCRIALVEDAAGKRWVIAMLMDQKMINKLPADARASAERVISFMKDMMVAASRGDL